MNRFVFKQANLPTPIQGALIPPKDRQSMSKWLKAAVKASQRIEAYSYSHRSGSPAAIDERFEIKDTIIGSTTIILKLELIPPTLPGNPVKAEAIEASLVIERTSSMGRN